MASEYPNKLSKNRPIYFAMDHTSSQDETIKNTVVNAFTAAGFTVKRATIGPSAMYQNMVHVYDNNLTDAVLVHLFNGVDPANIREVALYGNDNRGKTVRSRGNDVILAWFYDACDFTRPGGTCYESVRDSETNTGRLENPLQYCQENKIYVVNQSSNNHKSPENADYTGAKTAQSIIALFGEGGASAADGTLTPDANKTIQTKTITRTYTIPYYEKTFKARTDANGAFHIIPQLPYRGEYKVSMRYGGDKTHNGSASSISIYNFDSNAKIFNEQLLQTITSIKYTDGSIETEEKGSVGNAAHIKRVITTETYENGVLKNTTTKTIDVSSILEEAENNNTDISEIINTGSLTGTNSPFETKIPVNADGTPNISIMSNNGKQFVNVQTNRSYTLSEEQYRTVMRRDSKTLQLNGYKPSRYTCFESKDTDTYNVCKRETWNMLEESIHYYLVENNSRSFPAEVTFDFSNRQTRIGSHTVSWKGSGYECLLHFVADAQDWQYTCGPTSASVCTQVLHNYYSEKQLKNEGNIISPSGPEKIKTAVDKHEFSSQIITTNKTVALEELAAGRPTIWHFSGHYICLACMNPTNGAVLVCNSASSSTYTQQGSSSTAWHVQSAIKGAYGKTLKISLNWSMSLAEETSIRNFLDSMGGSWTRPDTWETVRRI